MKIYHWLLLVIFTLPYAGVKIYNEYKYNRNIYWFGMNRAEMVLSSLPIILNTMTIYKYNIVDRHWYTCLMILIISFLHSAMRFEEVKRIIEETELELKLEEKRKVENVICTYKDTKDSNNYEADLGGAGGSGYSYCPHSNYTVYYDSLGYAAQAKYNNTQPDIAKAYQSKNAENIEYMKFRLRQQSGYNCTLYNSYHEAKIDDITLIIKKICPDVKMGFDDGGYDYTKAGIVYDLGGGAKLKYTHYTEYWYLWDDKKELWMQLVMTDELLKQLQDILEGKE